MTPKVPASEAGTATLGIRAERRWRKKTNTTRITSPTEIANERSTSRSEARMVGVRSTATARSMAVGMEARSCGSSERTSSTVLMMLAPGCLNRISKMAGLPSATP